MNRTNFKVGDRVRIVSSKSTFFGHTGVITSIDSYVTRLVFQVRIDFYPGDSDATFYEESLIQIGTIDESRKKHTPVMKGVDIYGSVYCNIGSSLFVLKT